jgi:2'-5' RNA ligase
LLETLAPNYSIWLLPDEVQTVVFNNIIRNICDHHQSAFFHPHLTLFGDLPIADTAQCISSINTLRFPEVISLKVRDVCCCKGYFLSLFIQFDLPENLIRLRQILQSNFAWTDQGFIFPHLSLAYDWQGCIEKLAYQEKLKSQFVGTTINFTELALVKSSKTIAIHEWEILYTIDL